LIKTDDLKIAKKIYMQRSKNLGDALNADRPLDHCELDALIADSNDALKVYNDLRADSTFFQRLFS